MKSLVKIFLFSINFLIEIGLFLLFQNDLKNNKYNQIYQNHDFFENKTPSIKAIKFKSFQGNSIYILSSNSMVKQ